MPEAEPTSLEYLEQARDVIWDALQLLEHAQRVLFSAGDRYVAQVWGDGLRSLLDVTERLTEASGDLSKLHIEIGHIARRDGDRGLPP